MQVPSNWPARKADVLISVAEIAEMPLYRVTCGDVGTSADMVERYLNNVLTLGKEWNCGMTVINLLPSKC